MVEPYAFGYKSVWMAIKSIDPNKVFNVLAKYNVTGNVFNTPIDGFVLVESASIDDLLDEKYMLTGISDSEKLNSKNIVLIKNISRELGLVCVFLTHRTTEVHEWIKADKGSVHRAFHFYELVNLNYGFTPEEKELGYDFSDLNDHFEKEDINEVYDNFPDEECVIKIAESWSVNPLMLYDKYGEKPRVLEYDANDDYNINAHHTKSKRKNNMTFGIVLGVIILILPISAKIISAYFRIDRYQHRQQEQQSSRPNPRPIATSSIPDDVELTSLITLTIDEEYLVTRTEAPEFLDRISWVVIADGSQVLGRVADNELQYKYFANTEGVKYEVYIESFIGGKNQQVSNVVVYEP